MAMSNLIIKVARDTGKSPECMGLSYMLNCVWSGVHFVDDTTQRSSSAGAVSAPRFHTSTMEVQVQVARQQFTTHDDIGVSIKYQFFFIPLTRRIELSDSKAGWQSEEPDAKRTSSTKRTSATLFLDSDSVV